MSTAIWFPFICPVVGISNYQSAASHTHEGDAVIITAEPDNPYDVNACRIENIDGETIGYVPAVLAERLRAEGDERWGGTVESRYDGKTTIGIRVNVAHVETAEHSETPMNTSPTSAIVAAAHSHRVLGRYAGTEDSMVLVSTDTGIIRYPAALVVVETHA